MRPTDNTNKKIKNPETTIKKTDDRNKKRETENSQFASACQELFKLFLSDSPSDVHAFINKNSQVESGTRPGNKLLHVAILHALKLGNQDIVLSLVTDYKEQEWPNKDGYNVVLFAIHHALLLGKKNIVDALLANHSREPWPDHDGYEALHYTIRMAMHLGKNEIAVALVADNAQKDWPGKKGYKLCHYAISYAVTSGHKEVLRELVANHGKEPCNDTNGYNAVHLAISAAMEHDKQEIMTELLDHHGEKVSRNGSTVSSMLYFTIDEALKFGKQNLVAALVAKHTPPDLPNSGTSHASFYAINKAVELGKQKAITAIVAKLHDYSWRGSRGYSYLHYAIVTACQSRKKEIVTDLVAHYGDKAMGLTGNNRSLQGHRGECNWRGWNVMHYAISWAMECNQDEIVSALVDKHGHVTCTDADTDADADQHQYLPYPRSSTGEKIMVAHFAIREAVKLCRVETVIMLLGNTSQFVEKTTCFLHELTYSQTMKELFDRGRTGGHYGTYTTIFKAFREFSISQRGRFHDEYSPVDLYADLTEGDLFYDFNNANDNYRRTRLSQRVIEKLEFIYVNTKSGANAPTLYYYIPLMKLLEEITSRSETNNELRITCLPRKSTDNTLDEKEFKITQFYHNFSKCNLPSSNSWKKRGGKKQQTTLQYFFSYQENQEKGASSPHTPSQKK